MGGSCSKEFFNTTIANAYMYEINASVQDEEGQPASTKYGLKYTKNKAATGYELSLGYHNSDRGHTKIKPGDFLTFNYFAERSKTIYVSISSERRDIARNFQMKVGHNVIVDEDGYLKRAKCGSVWVDTSGDKHRYLPHKKFEKELGDVFATLFFLVFSVVFAAGLWRIFTWIIR